MFVLLYTAGSWVAYGGWVDEMFLIRRTLPSKNHLLKVYRFTYSIRNSQDGRE